VPLFGYLHPLCGFVKLLCDTLHDVRHYIDRYGIAEHLIAASIADFFAVMTKFRPTVGIALLCEASHNKAYAKPDIMRSCRCKSRSINISHQ